MLAPAASSSWSSSSWTLTDRSSAGYSYAALRARSSSSETVWSRSRRREEATGCSWAVRRCSSPLRKVGSAVSFRSPAAARSTRRGPTSCATSRSPRIERAARGHYASQAVCWAGNTRPSSPPETDALSRSQCSFSGTSSRTGDAPTITGIRRGGQGCRRLLARTCAVANNRIMSKQYERKERACNKTPTMAATGRNLG